METTIPTLQKTFLTSNTNLKMSIPEEDISDLNACGFLERKIILFAIKARLFFLACVSIKKPKEIWQTNKTMNGLRKNVWAGKIKKVYRISGKYYFSMYSPGWPSKEFDEVCKSEFRRHSSENAYVAEKTNFVFLAITRKCPMRCEHCFEWDNLNHREVFTKDDLLQTLDFYQKEGVQQFHFSGGEPMVRFKDLLDLLSHVKGKCVTWVLTSGFNCTPENARLLKQAGCTGVVVSIDHYIPEMHNIFRGHKDSFQHATEAVKAVKAAGMVSAISVCVTKAFIEGGHLHPYFEFAKELGVQFVQFLEPRDIGHYGGKNVLLDEKHIRVLEEFFAEVNHSKTYQYYPTLLYHGYHQRRVGCFSGSRSVYIDSIGDVHSCPFCHTKSFNIIDLIRAGQPIPQKENACPLFERIA